MRITKFIVGSVVTVLIASVQISSVYAQRKAFVDKSSSGSISISSEEESVRQAYEKMTIFDTSQRLVKAKLNGEPTGTELGLESLRFSLKDFRVGQIQDIQTAIYGDLVTPSNGEIVQLVINKSKQRNGETNTSIDSIWRSGLRTPDFDLQWTVGDVLQQQAVRFHDVTRYASYEVTVTLGGKTKAYRALALFHNLYQPKKLSNPEFLDNVVGTNGEVTQIARDTKLPSSLKRSARLPSDSHKEISGESVDKSTSVELDGEIGLNLLAPGDGGGCLEWYYTPIDPSYTFCMTWEPGGGGGGGGGGSPVQGGSNTILYRYTGEITSVSGYKACYYTACADTDRSPSNGCYSSSYETYTDIFNAGVVCPAGVRNTYTRYNIPIIGGSYCARSSHDDLTFNPCNPL